MVHLDDTDIVMTKNSNISLDYQGCRSYTLHVVKEGLTEVELKLKGPMGIEVTWTAPRSIFHMHL